MVTAMVVAVALLTSLAVDITAEPIDAHATRRTRNLYNVLSSVAHNRNVILVGKQNPTLFGLYGGHSPYWTYDYEGRQSGWMFNPAMAHANHSDELCDPCALTHDFPAVAGFDFGMVGGDVEDAEVYLVHKAHERGAIITFSYHVNNYVTNRHAWIEGDDEAFHSIQRILPGGDHYHTFLSDLDRIADFVNRKLRDGSGELIPIIFRPWHEADGGWFWWGQSNVAHNTPDDMKRLFQSTVTYLRDSKDLHNILYAFSPDCGGNSDVDLSIYPGNDYVDIIGSDCYLLPQRNAQYLKDSLEKTMQQASANGKIAALTETGVIQEPLTNHPHFFTQEVLASLASTSSGLGLAYLLTWTNQPKMGNAQYALYDPYPGHSLAQEYMLFYNDTRTFFLKDLRTHYPLLYV